MAIAADFQIGEFAARVNDSRQGVGVRFDRRINVLHIPADELHAAMPDRRVELFAIDFQRDDGVEICGGACIEHRPKGQNQRIDVQVALR